MFGHVVQAQVSNHIRGILTKSHFGRCAAAVESDIDVIAWPSGSPFRQAFDLHLKALIWALSEPMLNWTFSAGAMWLLYQPGFSNTHLFGTQAAHVGGFPRRARRLAVDDGFLAGIEPAYKAFSCSTV